MSSSANADLALMRAAMLLESDPAAAAGAASDILAASPRHQEASLLLAAACRRLGDGATAIGLLESLIKTHSESATIWFELGRAYSADSRAAEALGALTRAVELDPAFADAWCLLAAERLSSGDTLGGDRAYAAYARLRTDPPELNPVRFAVSEKRWDSAERQLWAHLGRAPDDTVALRMAAELAARRGDAASAEGYLKRSLAIAPGDAVARYELARLLHTTQERTSEVLPLLDRLLAADPDNVEYLVLRAQAIRLVGRNAEAIAIMERASTLRPDACAVPLIFGILMREMGHRSAAESLFRRALALKPGLGEAYFNLADLKTFRFTPEDLATMRAQLADGSGSEADRVYLEFALGKACEDEGDFDAAFAHYQRANAAQRASIPYDAAAHSARTQRSKRLLTSRFFAERRDWGTPQDDPIFIVGLPRSGSTLIEQILASHSQIEGTQELADIPNFVSELIAATPLRTETAYPQVVVDLDQPAVAALAARYLAQTAVHRPLQRPRFVDKMLSNFQHIGLIQLMFPRAAIIDARRHPLACGLSCYRQLFARGQYFTYDLVDLGGYYRDYAELMEHFDRELPGRVHRVHYEQLVADPEQTVRRLLEHCGLEFEPACLRFYENRRTVMTISSEQVRRPIYTDAVDQWRHFEPWLGPLQAAVGDLVERYPEFQPTGPSAMP
jgi:tetratricopeptide (TPR) repeat protein